MTSKPIALIQVEHLRHRTPACFADLRETLFSNDVGVLPLGETALARQLKFSALRGLETTQPRPMMTGPTKSEDRWGIKLPHHWDREFPRSPERVRTGSTLGDVGSEISRTPEVEKP